MPELPEIQTVVTDLQSLIGKQIIDVQTNTEKQFNPPFAKFVKQIKNLKIKKIERRGKYIIFFLEKQKVMVAHFRMTGHFLINITDPFIRSEFILDNGIILNYSDIRKFGKFWLSDKNNFKQISGLNKLGIEPFDQNFTFARFQEIIKSSKGTLKTFLLNQSKIAGIGNIYADEAAFKAGLHPLSRIEKIPTDKLKDLYNSILSVLKQGIKNRGTTRGEFVDTKGKTGQNQHKLKAYQRGNLPCLNCGTKMQRMVVAQRGTTVCLKCQIKY